VRRYFLRGDGDRRVLVKVRPELLKMVIFEPLNLLAPVWPLTNRYDAIFCRNVLIYFDRPDQKQVLQHCRRHLAPDGLFFAGHSVSLNHVSDLFDACGKTVYRPHEPGPPHAPQPSFAEDCYA
jgi:chemotaxis protein methyltransferase CheR